MHYVYILTQIYKEKIYVAKDKNSPIVGDDDVLQCITADFWHAAFDITEDDLGERAELEEAVDGLISRLEGRYPGILISSVLNADGCSLSADYYQAAQVEADIREGLEEAGFSDIEITAEPIIGLN